MTEVLIELLLAFVSGLLWFLSFDVADWLVKLVRPKGRSADKVEERAAMAFRAVDKELKRQKKRIKKLERRLAEFEPEEDE